MLFHALVSASIHYHMRTANSYGPALSNSNPYSGAAHMFGPGPSHLFGMSSTNNTGQQYSYYNMELMSGFNAGALSEGWTVGGHPLVELDAAMESLLQNGVLDDATWDHMDAIAE